ncbi:Flagellar assembly factor FliW [Dissulfuribacter thermophilus]|uniref:Flagellar assembly factor FliW n=1 Tax=Dissulfuribacter thermophilus TaxID=1156395 RepID=A0A1B9F716_9BACT|nr:flagellar assembly protein FliW [Dissulfuribacter thermophilus]OCC15561.1 Flagellar assembly factor FliW [Dissulfuribacter thermophilus]
MRQNIDMEINTTRFGTIEIEEEKIIKMTRGLLGFPDDRRYVLIPHKEGSPFHWLQSVDTPALAFVVTSPGRFFSDYVFDISDEIEKELEIEAPEDVDCLVIITIPKDNPKKLTANLLGPIVINVKKRLACQVVLDPNVYPVKCPLLPEE